MLDFFELVTGKAQIYLTSWLIDKCIHFDQVVFYDYDSIMYVFFIHRKLILRYSLPVQESTGESCKTLNIPTNKRNKQINFSENSNKL